MKAKTIQLFFLILTGLIIGWREWTSTPTLVKEEVFNWYQFHEVGSTSEASIVLLLFFLGATSVVVINGWRQALTKLSSPNSV